MSDLGKNLLIGKVKALGNSNVKLSDLASDLVNKHGDLKEIADGSFLHISTVKRIASLDPTLQGDEYKPNADTVERIFKFFNAEVQIKSVAIKPRFKNQAK